MQLSLSIDIGGTKCAVGLVTRDGELIDRTSVSVNPRDTADDLFSDISFYTSGLFFEFLPCFLFLTSDKLRLLKCFLH